VVEKKIFFIEKAGAMKNIGEAVDEILHECGNIHAVYGRSKNYSVGRMYLLFDNRGIIFTWTMTLAFRKTDKATTALRQIHGIEH
jgi:hypothetical protein